MIVYYWLMRHKDENKSEAILQATVSLLNEIGFSEISMSKIAKRANVSSSTIYVYFENKEDMLNKLYLTIKEKMSQQIVSGIDERTGIREGVEAVLRNTIHFIITNKDYFLFLEQFSNSPLIQKMNQEKSSLLFKPIVDLLERGKQEKALKPVDTNLLLAFVYGSITVLGKEILKGTFDHNQENIKEMIQMTWDAIKA